MSLGRRFIIGGIAGVVLLATTAVTPATAADGDGVGTSDGSLTVASVDAGDLISVVLGEDGGSSNIDDAAGDVEALVSLVAARVTSGIAGLDLETPPVESRSSGAENTTTVSPIGISNPALSAAIVPGELMSAVGDAGAVSALTSALDEVSLLAGVANLTGGKVGLFTGAGPNASATHRGLTIDQVGALDLTALLDGLGLSLLDLDVDTVLALVDELGLTDDVLAVIPANAAASEAQTAVELPVETPIDTVVDDLVVTIDDVVAEIGDATCDGELGDDLQALCDALDQLTDLLDEILGTALELLDGVSLLSVDGVEAGVFTTAASTVEDSSAEITAAIGDIVVAGQELGSLDLTDTLEQINALVATVDAAIGDILGVIDPSLADLVSVSVLEQATDVSEDAGVVTARAALTALSVEINPDVQALLGLLDGLSAENSLGTLLADLGVELPVSPVDALNGLLGPLTGADAGGAAPAAITDGVGTLVLSDGASVTLGSIEQTSVFRVSTQTPAGDTPSELPRTGGNASWLLFGSGALVVALGLRRWSARATA